MTEQRARGPQRIWAFIMRHRASIGDLSVLAAILGVALYVALSADVFITEGHETAGQVLLELDEILALSSLLGIGLLVFAIRRYLAQRREVRRRTEAEHRARILAYQDPLTGLANRRQFGEALAIAIAQPPSAELAHGLFLLDLNGFKQVNDVHGHGIGDEVLIVVAQRLLAAARPGDLVARFGGDEFAVLMRDLNGPDAAGAIARRIIEQLHTSIATGSTSHTLGIGIGIALLGTETAEETLRRADVALYRAKAEHRSALRFFEAGMDASVREHELIERTLRGLIEDHRIAPLFQPNLDLRSGRVIGFEAVLPPIAAGDLEIGPERYVPIAEESGLIHRLAEDLLRDAGLAARAWPAGMPLAIDIFPTQLRDPGLPQRLLGILAETGLDPRRLEVEIAEAALVRNPGETRAICSALSEAGVRIALDNFGTGYSSLYHLREFHLDKVKIDRSFIDSAVGGDGGRVMAALAGLGHGLGLEVSVAGLSDALSSAAALNLGIEQGQGKAFGAPLSHTAAEAMVAVPPPHRQAS